MKDQRLPSWVTTIAINDLAVLERAKLGLSNPENYTAPPPPTIKPMAEYREEERREWRKARGKKVRKPVKKEA